MSATFTERLRDIMVTEQGKTPEEAERLIKKHPKVVIQGIMHGLGTSSLAATGMALEMAETDNPG